MSDPSRKIGSFRVDVFHKSSDEPLNYFVGTGDEWHLHPVMNARHMGDSYSVHVDTVWVELLKGSEDRIVKDVEGYCTIVKFGGTMQLKEPFRVVVEVNL